MSQNPIIELEQIKLYAQKIAAENRYSKSELFAVPMTLDARVDYFTGDLVVRLEQQFLSQRLDKLQVQYPRDWWQAVKAQFAPSWFLRKWPVLMYRWTVDVEAYYPQIAWQPGQKVILVGKTRGEEVRIEAKDKE